MLTATLLIGCVAELGEDGAPGTASKPLATGQGTVFDTGGLGLNVRAAPNTGSSIVTAIAEGTTVNVGCQTTGESVSGNNVWDYLPSHGGYVSDAFLYTGYDGFIPGVSRCGEQSADSGGGGGCGDVDYAGYCDGETLVWCENDALQSFDCGSRGQSCGYQNDSVGYNCLASGSGSTSSSGSSGRLTIGEIVGGASYSVTQNYGPTSFDGGYSYCHSYGNFSGLTHCGIDIGIPYGTPMYVPAGGSVVIAGGSGYFRDETNAAAGELRLELYDGTHVILGHMSRIDLGVGQAVNPGQQAGLSGTANGPHLHLEVRVRDNNYASGYRTVDPASYFGL